MRFTLTQCNHIIMGCSSEMGCLGPRPREREVYVDLIETIYHEVEQMSLPTEQDPYEFIKSRLVKRGLLRKLTDNLKSHKSNIYECVNQNFQISSQSSQSQSRVASLIVVDKIMEELFRLHRSSEESALHERYIPQGTPALTKPVSSILSVNSWNLGENLGDYKEFDHRIDIVFFKEIIFLLQNEKKLEGRIIKSITEFAKNKQESIVIKGEIYTLLDFLFRKIQKKPDSVQAFAAFQLLLKRMKENLKQEEKDMRYIKFLMDVGSRVEQSSKQISNVCQSVLTIYFSKYFNDYLILYRLMVELFDQLAFQGKQVWTIWEMMVKIAREVDNYSNFVRGMFIFVLRYIMAHEQLSPHTKLTYKLDEFSLKDYKNIYQEECKLNAFKMVTLWISSKYIDIDESILYSSALIVMTYVTNYVMGVSQTIKEELKTEFYKIISLLNAKSNQIIIDLLIEEIKDRETPNKKRKMILVVIKEIITLKKMLANLEEMQNYNIFIILQPYYSLDFNLQIISFSKSILKSIKSQYVNGANYDPSQLRQRLCDFLHSIYACIISEEELHEQSEAYIKANFFRKSRNLQDLNQAKTAMLQMNKFTTEINSIIKVLIEQHFYIIVVAFIESINDAMQSLSEIGSEDQTFTLIFFVQLIKRHALFSINKRERLPEEMYKLHLKLQEGHISNAIRNDVLSLSQKLIKECEAEYFVDENEQFQNVEGIRGSIGVVVRSDCKRISAAKEFYMFNQLEYGQVMSYFRQHFRYPSGKSTLKKDPNDSLPQIRHFHRNSSLNMSHEEFQRDRESVQQEGDESFQDILTKLNQR